VSPGIIARTRKVSGPRRAVNARFAARAFRTPWTLRLAGVFFLFPEVLVRPFLRVAIAGSFR
jgi:hypothetical protein